MDSRTEDYPEIARKNDRTFRNIIENLRVAKNRELAVEKGQFTENLTQTWREKYRQAVKKYPTAEYVYDAVELLRGLNLRLHPQLVLLTAGSIISERGFRRLKVLWQMRSVVLFLDEQDGILQPRDGQIEGKSTPTMTVDKVAPQKIIRRLCYVWAGYSSEVLVNEIVELGNALYKLGRLDDAIASYDRAIEIKPNDDRAWDNRGVALGNLGRWDEAITSYDRSIEINPDNDRAWDSRGVALSKLGKFDEAILSHDRALLIQPQSLSAIYNLACCHALQGNINESINYLKQAIQLDPHECINLARQDDDFQLLRDEPRFIALLNLGV